jgi:hypothetical protein
VSQDYKADIEKYTSNVSDTAVANIVKYCGIALRSNDASMVSTSDKSELDRVRDGFAKKKLALEPDAAEAGIKKVAEQMKGERRKSRVTFYYLLAEATGTMDKLG